MSGIYRQQESGRSMIEIIGVLAIMGLMTAAAFVLIRNGMATQKRNAVIDDVSKIMTGVRTLYADYDDLSSLDGAGALAAVGVDEKGPYEGSKYSVAKTKNASDVYSRFTVTISGLPARDCTVLAARKWADSVEKSSSCGTGTRNSVSIIYEK